MRLVDISSNNHGKQPINFNQLREAGYGGVYIKCGEGISTGHSTMYINPYLSQDYWGAREAGLQVGLYWFYNSSFSVEQQANLFNTYLITMPTTLCPMFDYEVGIPTAAIRNGFLRLVPKCGQYVDRSFLAAIGYVTGTWVADPSWNGEAIEADLVQTGSISVPGMPNGNTDVNQVLNINKLLMEVPTGMLSASGKVINAPAVAIMHTPSNAGYWIVFADGGVDSFGDAKFYGSLGGKPINRPICNGSPTSTGNGYWLVGEDGGVFAFGDAGFHGTA